MNGCFQLWQFGQFFFEKIYLVEEPAILSRVTSYSTPDSRMSYFECPTPYKCALLRIDTIRSPTPNKNPTPVGELGFQKLFLQQVTIATSNGN